MASAFPNAGRAFAATAIKTLASGIYVAMGKGLAAWGSSPPDPSLSQTAMTLDGGVTTEIGRRKAAQVTWATTVQAGSVGGPIVTDKGTFYLAATPTNYLYILGQFDFEDGVDETVREVGVFGGVTHSGNDANLILPAQLTDPGSLMAVSRFAGFVRVNTVKQNFEFVIEL